LARVHGGRGTATRTVGLLGAIFAYAVRHRMRADNPVHGVTRFADGKRHRRLSDDEYKALGDALRQAAAVAAARFLALTGWRSGEVLGLRWDEIDLARRTATLGDTKTGRSVRPLSHAACDVMRNLARSGDLVFPATRGNGDLLMSGFKKLWYHPLLRLSEADRADLDRWLDQVRDPIWEKIAAEARAYGKLAPVDPYSIFIGSALNARQFAESQKDSPAVQRKRKQQREQQ